MVCGKKSLEKKNVKGTPLILVKRRQNDSHFWKGVLEVKDDFFKYCKNVVGNDKLVSFGEIFGVEISPFLSGSRDFLTWLVIKIILLKSYVI